MEDFSSAEYWDSRYRKGRNSGAGSYGRLQRYKARFINDLVRLNQVRDIIDFGTGDGSFASQISCPLYVGVDVSQTAIERNRERFSGRQDLRFCNVAELDGEARRDLALSLAVIYHLVEDEVFERYMSNLFLFAKRFVVIYASNRDRNPSLKHVRHRAFSKYVATAFPEWQLAAIVPNVYPFQRQNPRDTSYADFYVYRRPGVDLVLSVPSAEGEAVNN